VEKERRVGKGMGEMGDGEGTEEEKKGDRHPPLVSRDVPSYCSAVVAPACASSQLEWNRVVVLLYQRTPYEHRWHRRQNRGGKGAAFAPPIFNAERQSV